jgi:hypothetical protein
MPEPYAQAELPQCLRQIDLDRKVGELDYDVGLLKLLPDFDERHFRFHQLNHGSGIWRDAGLRLHYRVHHGQ